MSNEINASEINAQVSNSEAAPAQKSAPEQKVKKINDALTTLLSSPNLAEAVAAQLPKHAHEILTASEASGIYGSVSNLHLKTAVAKLLDITVKNAGNRLREVTTGFANFSGVALLNAHMVSGRKFYTSVAGDEAVKAYVPRKLVPKTPKEESVVAPAAETAQEPEIIEAMDAPEFLDESYEPEFADETNEAM